MIHITIMIASGASTDFHTACSLVTGTNKNPFAGQKRINKMTQRPMVRPAYKKRQPRGEPNSPEQHCRAFGALSLIYLLALRSFLSDVVPSLVASVDTVGVDPSVTLYVGMGVVTGTTIGVVGAVGAGLGWGAGILTTGLPLGIALTLGTKLTLGIALGAPHVLGVPSLHVLGVELLLVLEEPLLPLLEEEVEGLLLLLEVE